jgi:hypothetical protein
VPDAFYTRLDDDRVRPTVLTAGPWDPGHQHAGPPAALLGGALASTLDGATGDADGLVVRVTYEILRPVRVDRDLEVATTVLRPGRKVALAEGHLADDDGPLLLARAWWLRREAIDVPAAAAPSGSPVPGPDDATPAEFFRPADEVGYHTAMDVRFLRGSWLEPGPAFAWMRPRVPVVAGEDVTPLQRVLVAADSGNGISAVLPIGSWLFVNTDLTVHLHRHPAGEWVGLDARTDVQPHGTGLAQSSLRDATGPLGRSLQSLLVAPAG